MRLPVFDGTHANFQVWWMRFTAFAIVHWFKAAISPEGAEDDLPATEATAIPARTDGAPTRAAVRRNSVAYANLSLALNSEQFWSASWWRAKQRIGHLDWHGEWFKPCIDDSNLQTSSPRLNYDECWIKSA